MLWLFTRKPCHRAFETKSDQRKQNYQGPASMNMGCTRSLPVAVLGAVLALAHGNHLSAAHADGGAHAPTAARPVTPRGDLAPEEKATIELFQRSRDSVVFISTKAAVVDLWNRNVTSVPRGTGSG